MEPNLANGSATNAVNAETWENVGCLPKTCSDWDVDENAQMLQLEELLRSCANFDDDALLSDGQTTAPTGKADCEPPDRAVIIRDDENGVFYKMYKSEEEMPRIMELITKDLSEPYSIYTYRYFIHNWPHLCILAHSTEHPTQCVGAVVGKLEQHKYNSKRGYIAMLAVEKNFRRRRIGSLLVKMAIKAMQLMGCSEVFLETEVVNEGALRFYERLGFVRDKRLFRYYLNGGDAYRLKLWL